MKIFLSAGMICLSLHKPIQPALESLTPALDHCHRIDFLSFTYFNIVMTSQSCSRVYGAGVVFVLIYEEVASGSQVYSVCLLQAFRQARVASKANCPDGTNLWPIIMHSRYVSSGVPCWYDYRGCIERSAPVVVL